LLLLGCSDELVIEPLYNPANGRDHEHEGGPYALFPHWRSDGWIYFQVRDRNTRKEYIVASDAALP